MSSVWDRTFAISMYSSSVNNIVSGLSFSGFFLGGNEGQGRCDHDINNYLCGKIGLN